ncbi:MAG: DNA translocase FtsK [Gemmatimonadetes bacterium]|nr:DNA translocase FtsK [Gemmatimonadota bacterium]
MGLTPDRRRELAAILSLAAGVFLGLSLLPIPLTGPLGRIVGDVLWKGLGLGSLLLPALLLIVGIIRFGWLSGLDARRIAILMGGLVLLVPFGIAVAVGLETISDLPPSYEQWAARHKVVGLVPAFLAITISGWVGTAGTVIVGLLGLSALTISTVGWHPLKTLRRSESAAVRDRRAYQASFIEPELSPGEAPAKLKAPLLARRKKPEKSGTAADQPAAGDEQAFISEAAAKPFPYGLLNKAEIDAGIEDEAELDRLGRVLVDTLKTFKVDVTLGRHRSTGPVVTQFELSPAAGVKVGRIAALADDLALKMEAQSIRIVAPIPGKAFVGIEVPNPTPRMVALAELLGTPPWNPDRPGLPIALGTDLEGRPVMADLTKMPHLLIAGATGSGKSVCVNTIITALIYRYNERQLQMLMIDPKMVELTVYNALPHMRHPVVTNNRDAAKALKWVLYEMEDRYELFSVNNVRNLHEFNRKVKEGRRVVMPRPPQETLSGTADDQELTQVVPYEGSTLPFIVVIVEELADLMMTVQAEVEKPLAILAQKARATGIHIILATQRPSVNVVTGLIKANFPSRIAFRVASKVDSRTILDQNGAETLLGNGDMLFLPPGKSEPVRLQGAYIDTSETERITGWYGEQRMLREKKRGAPVEAAAQEDILAVVAARESREEASAEGGGARDLPQDRDPLFREAAEVCVQNGGGSTSLLQRKLRIGYGRAARVVDQLNLAGILGPADGAKAREVLIGAGQLDEYCK